ncbi:ABC transporter permease [Guggenheimella bovis]
MLAIIKNNIRLIFSSGGTLFLLVILPVLLTAVGLLLSSSSGGISVNVAIEDLDQTTLSKSVETELKSQGIKILPQEDLKKALLNGNIDMYLTIEKGFEESILKGESKGFKLTTLKGQEITMLTEMGLNFYEQNILAIQKASNFSDPKELIKSYEGLKKDGLQVKSKPLNDQMKSKGINVAGGFFIYILSINMLMIGEMIMVERQNNTLSRIRQSSISKTSYILANMATGVFFLLLNLKAVQVLTVLFKTPTRFEMFVIWFIYGLIWIFIGIFFALTMSSRRANSIATQIITVIGAMLGGCYWPLNLMPDFMQKIAMITPQYWANNAIIELQRGTSIFKINSILALAGFLALFFSLCVFAMRSKKAQEFFA